MSFRIPFPLQHSPPPEPPVAVGAVQSASNEVTVTFDKPLQLGVLEVSNWSLTGGFGTPIVSATASGMTVVVVAGSDNTFTQVAYDPPPFDVVGVNGAAVEAFSLPV